MVWSEKEIQSLLCLSLGRGQEYSRTTTLFGEEFINVRPARSSQLQPIQLTLEGENLHECFCMT